MPTFRKPTSKRRPIPRTRPSYAPIRPDFRALTLREIERADAAARAEAPQPKTSPGTRTNPADKQSARRTGLCAACEVPYDEKTPGCKRCYNRHAGRRNALRDKHYLLLPRAITPRSTPLAPLRGLRIAEGFARRSDKTIKTTWRTRSNGQTHIALRPAAERDELILALVRRYGLDVATIASESGYAVSSIYVYLAALRRAGKLAPRRP